MTVYVMELVSESIRFITKDKEGFIQEVEKKLKEGVPFDFLGLYEFDTSDEETMKFLHKKADEVDFLAFDVVRFIEKEQEKNK